MRFLLTLLALIAGLATPGMTLATARAQVAGAEQVETAGAVSRAAAVVGTPSQRPAARQRTPRALTGPIVVSRALANCSIALSDRPLE